MAEPKLVETQLPMETFCDHAQSVTFDGALIRIDFAVSRFPHVTSADHGPAERYIAARLVLHPFAALRLGDLLTQLTAELMKRGILQKTAPTPLSEREFVMNNNGAPATWRIWMGQMTEWIADSSYFTGAVRPISELENIPRRVDSEPPLSNDTQFTTFGIGPVLFATFSSPRDDIRRSWTFPAGARRRLVEIWPARTEVAKWPRTFQLDPAQTHAVHRFVQESWDGLRLFP